MIVYRKGHVSPNGLREIQFYSWGQTHALKGTLWLTLTSWDQLEKTQSPLTD